MRGLPVKTPPEGGSGLKLRVCERKGGWWSQWMNMKRRQVRREDQLAGSAGEGDPVFLLQSSLWLLCEELTEELTEGGWGGWAECKQGDRGGGGERWEVVMARRGGSTRIAWACHWEVAHKIRGEGWLGVWALAPSGLVRGISGGWGGQESGPPNPPTLPGPERLPVHGGP